MSEFIQDALALSQQSEGPVWLQQVRQQARELIAQQPFPTRKTEHWKYSPLTALVNSDYLHQAQQPEADIYGLAEYFQIECIHSTRLVFIDGQYNEDISSPELPEGIQLTRFADADELQKGMISQFLGQGLAKADDPAKHLFAQLNNSELDDGVFLYVPRNVQLENPIQVVNLTTRQNQPFHVQQRVLVVLDEGAEATLIEQFVSTRDEQNSLTNSVTELLLAENSKLHHYRLNMEQNDAIHLGGVHAVLKAHSTLDSFCLALGTRLTRNDIVVHHAGSGAHCELNGVYLPSDKQHVDYHTTIEHAVPHCTSNEVFRGIMADQSRAVFNGRIHIHPDAQKTLAELSNKNLLLSNQAEVNTKPELEIYADDVRCAHGATVSQMDETALYYLQTRGIPRKEAEVMLNFGFINELVSGLKLEPMQEYLRVVLAGLFSQDENLTRHLR